MSFRDRTEAGKELAKEVRQRASPDCVVYALPRGGLPVAVEVAKALACPLDILMVRKLRAPFNPEVAIGAVVDGDHPQIVINEDLGGLAPTDECIAAAAALELQEIKRRRMTYMHGHHPQAATGHVAIIVDDGIATGATIRGAILALRRQHPKQIILAVPVAPTSVVEGLKAEVDAVICLETHEPFNAVGEHYLEFGQVTDQEVVACLAQHRMWLADHQSRHATTR